LSGNWGERHLVSWFLGILLVLADLWAIRTTLRTTYTWRVKWVWCLVIAVLPILGFLLWKVAGPQRTVEPPDESPSI